MKNQHSFPFVGCGSLIFTRTPGSAFSNFTIWCESFPDDPALASHVAIGVGQSNVFQAQFRQGLKMISRQEFFQSLVLAGAEWCIYDHVEPATAAEALNIEATCNEMDTWHYSVLELPIQMIALLIFKFTGYRPKGWDAVIIRKFLCNVWKKGVICSATVSRFLRKIKWLPGFLQYVSPEELRRYVNIRPTVWSMGERSDGW